MHIAVGHNVVGYYAYRDTIELHLNCCLDTYTRQQQQQQQQQLTYKLLCLHNVMMSRRVRKHTKLIK